MYPSVDKLKTLLLKEHYISDADAKDAEANSSDSDGFVSYLIAQELLSKETLGQAIAEAYKLPYADMTRSSVSEKEALTVPEDIARDMRLVVARFSDLSIQLATDTPEKIKPKVVKRLFPEKKIALAYTLPEYVDAKLDIYRQPLALRFTEIIANSDHIAPEIVDAIIEDALLLKASDIHFEPYHDSVKIRFRIDGTLREAGQIDRFYYENILNRVKVESGMRIDEHLVSQDGSMMRENSLGQVDLRVSLIPTVEGEKIVMRLLGSYVAGLTFNGIGFVDESKDVVERNVNKPFGMILVVGPTGSGKTTTLYSLLKMLDKPETNITTIEDPVEYKIAGINQIQVREQGNMTFARGLRSIVRQDPDVILVGEIRDTETAEIAVNAALTGHLLLSSFSLQRCRHGHSAPPGHGRRTVFAGIHPGISNRAALGPKNMRPLPL